jgi:hypothetical protein
MNKPGIVILNAEKRIARMTFSVPLGGSYRVSNASVKPDELAGIGFSQADLSQALKGGDSVHSFFFDTNVQVDSGGARGPKFETIEDVKPQETDYIFPLFRALSATLIEGHWIDFTKPGVLEESVPLLLGQTVYKNHDYHDVEKWLGAVNQAVWDARGEAAGNVPGINAELKIDWKVSPIIARGLLMTPPAIHSVSVTVLTEWEYSHPQLAAEDKWKWRELLGEEVDGEIVRYIVTKILAYWEISLVFQGADGLAKNGGVEDAARDEFQSNATVPSLSAPPPAPTTPAAAPPSTETEKEKPTVKLTAEQKKRLGLEAIEGDDVPEDVVLPALEKFTREAETAVGLTRAARAECLKFAKLAELGAEDGELSKATEKVINAADGEDLAELTEEYRQRAEKRFSPTCQDCGSRNVAKRSSVETPPEEHESAHPARPSVSSADYLHY